MSRRYTMDTKGCCVLCLTSAEEEAEDEDKDGTVTGLSLASNPNYSLQKISRYLGMDLKKVFNVAPGVPHVSDELLQKNDILAALCKKCFVQWKQFNQFHHALEQIQLKLDRTLQSIYNVLRASEKSPGKKMKYMNKFQQSDPLELIKRNVTDKFRCELIGKVSLKFKDDSTPSSHVSLLQARGLEVRELSKPVKHSAKKSTSPRTIPYLSPPVSSAGGLERDINLNQARGNVSLKSTSRGSMVDGGIKRPRSLGTNHQRNCSTDVEVIDLDDSDSENAETEKEGKKKDCKEPQVEASQSSNSNVNDEMEVDTNPLLDDETESGIVIKSVSGSNGLIMTAIESEKLAAPTPPSIPLPSSTVVSTSDTLSSVTVSGSDLSFSSNPATTTTTTTTDTQSALDEADSFLNSLFGISSGVSSGVGNSNSFPDFRSDGVRSSFNPNCNRVVATEDMFKIFDNGRCQCQICGKTIGNYVQTKEAHKLIHLNMKPFKCIHCPTRFRNVSNLKAHILGYHRADMLGPYRKENITPEMFKNIVAGLFREIKKSGDPQHPWICQYCSGTYKNKPNLEAHLIQVHSDNLGKELKARQENGGYLNVINTLRNSASNALSNLAHLVAKQTSEMNLSSQGRARVIPNPLALGRQRFPLPNPSLSSTWFTSGKRPSLPGFSIPGFQSNKVKCRICGKLCFDKNALRRHHLLFHANSTNNASSMPNPNTTMSSMTSASRGHQFTSVPATPSTSTKVSSSGPGLATSLRSTTSWTKCSYCPRRFQFSGSIRSHTLSMHRYELFRKHFPKNTPKDVVLAEVKETLDECTPLGDNSYGCSYCSRNFAQRDVDHGIFQAHALQSHFQEVVAKVCGKYLEKMKRNEVKAPTWIPPPIDISDVEDNSTNQPKMPSTSRLTEAEGGKSAQAENVLSNAGNSDPCPTPTVEPIKSERENEDCIMEILPD